ncbi:kelch repeat-containing protein [Vitiosangium sp. GDMCC 1.1324]|uniref:Kelch repeat-containing protein n=1 Tax=Vitiosangium sp. (strain GDMCC 1.1324) TaxID=2138576 RepID=UPI000D36871F|nr:kelch repeat-containing protein [Vitiosangium sp. GDMCC 1.1324]PTL79540.1 hypothetical protein DAT35_32510 [Vitiosangium sp. GDMCC 1.1324]
MRTVKLAASLAAALLTQACGNPTAEVPSQLATSAAALTSGVSRGCTFTASYREVFTPTHGFVPFVTRQASSTCAWGAASVDLPMTYANPTLSLAANDLGVAVGYTNRWSPSGSSTTRVTLIGLAPATLAVVRSTELVSTNDGYTSSNVYSGEVSLLGNGLPLKVQGRKQGYFPGETGSGEYYVATYSNFFTSTTAPTITASATPPQVVGTWVSNGNLLTARSSHTATLLNSGEVLVVSDSTAEVFNPYGKTSQATGAPIYPRIRHTATRLSSGKVLVAGGWIGTEPLYWRHSAEVFDPATGTWTATDFMTTPRGNHTATLLDSGKVLVVGGDSTNFETGSNKETGTAELYDPATNAWSSAGTAGARARHAATLLYSGKVLVTGGRYSSVGELMDAQVYDPATNTWTQVPAMPGARTGHLAIRLYSGNVMVVGGGRDSVDIYDPYNNRWFAGPSLDNGYSAVSATLLYSGEVLVTLFNGQAALYDPSTNTWQSAGTMSTGLSAHAATLLDSGDVLVTGGSSNGSAISIAQRYVR